MAVKTEREREREREFGLLCRVYSYVWLCCVEQKDVHRRTELADNTWYVYLSLYLYLHNTIYNIHQQQVAQAGQRGHKVTLYTVPDLS